MIDNPIVSPALGLVIAGNPVVPLDHRTRSSGCLRPHSVPRVRVDKEQIKTFAAEFDPQPFHLDEAAARDTIFRGLAASGWHTAALTMRLMVETELNPAGSVVGAG